MKIKELTGKEIAKFIDVCNSGRIRRASLDYYNNAKDGDFYGVGMYINNELRGVSACDYERKFGITLLRAAYQKKGHGKTLLKHKLDHFTAKHIPYETTVAADNIPSFKMCVALGMQVIKTEIKTRSNGEYIALTLSN